MRQATDGQRRRPHIALVHPGLANAILETGELGRLHLLLGALAEAVTEQQLVIPWILVGEGQQAREAIQHAGRLGHGRHEVAARQVFGLFHFTYPTPWNTLETAATVGLVWVGVSILFVVSRSLPAAVVFNNIMATVGFATRSLTLPLSPTTSLVIEICAVAAFVLAFSWARPS